jgi:ABC-2 type transport system ATP-binding protein
MGYAIETYRLSKSFDDINAVRNLDLIVEVGEIFGFLGPNGAGKSTTIRLFLDEIRPTSGTVQVLGLDSHTDLVEVHRRIGYLPGELHLPSDLTAGEYLDFLTKLRGGIENSSRTELVDRFDLDPSRRLGQLSTGNKQKVGLVQAFMHQPELVLLDEPTAGLDPLIQHDFHEMLTDLAAAGTTIFLSSHTLSEVDRVAHRVGIIRQGRLITVNTVAALKAQARRSVSFEFASPPDVSGLVDIVGVVDVHMQGNIATVTIEGSVDAMLRHVLRIGTVVSVTTPEADLEDVFLDYYRDEHEGES